MVALASGQTVLPRAFSREFSNVWLPFFAFHATTSRWGDRVPVDAELR
jgi:hypothetical protein